MLVPLIELYPSVPFSATLIIFHGHCSVKIFYWKFPVLVRSGWNLHRLDHEYTSFWRSLVFKRDNVGFFSDTIKARSSTFCTTVTLLWVYIFFQHLMTLTLFQGHRCVWNVNCKLCVCAFFLILDHCSLNVARLRSKKVCTIWFVLSWCVFKGGSEHIFGRSSVWASEKL